MIREAKLEDIPIILTMGNEFLKESKVNVFIPYDEITLYNFVLNGINNSTSTILLYEDSNKQVLGFIGGIIFPHPFNNNIKIAAELVWWVYPEHRGTVGKPLLNSFEIWGKSNSVNIISVMSLENMNPTTIDKIYKKQGYQLIEHSYFKEV